VKNISVLIAALSLLLILSSHSGWTRSSKGVALFKTALELTGKARSAADLEKAAKTLEKAATIFKKAGDLKGRAEALEKLGGVLESLGKFPEAGESYEKSADLAGKIPAPAFQSDALTRLGKIRQKMGLRSDALESFEKALAIREKLGDDKGRARALNNLGDVYEDLGRYAEAAKRYEKCLEIAREIKSPGLEAAALGDLGTVSMDSGRYDQAFEFFKNALPLARKQGDSRILERSLINLGYVNRDRGQYSKASAYFAEALDLVRKTKNPESESLLLANLGDLCADWGLYARALDYYEEALALSKNLADLTDQSRNLTRISRILAQRGKYRSALDKLLEARSIARKIGLSTADSDRLIGELYLDAGLPDKAARFVKEAGSDSSLGRYYLAKSQFDKALEHYERLLRSSEKGNDASGLVTAFTGMGKACEGKGDYGTAEQYFRKAVELTEELRSRLLPAARKSFLSVKVNGFERAEPARGLTRVMFKLGRPADSIVLSELTRARSFADRLALGPDNGYSGVPLDVQRKEAELVTRVAALKKMRDCCRREVNPGRFDGFTRKIKESEAELSKFIDMLWKDYAPYAAVKYPRPVKLDKLDLGDTQYIVVFDVLGDGVGIKLIKGKRLLAGEYTKWNAVDLAKTVAEFRKPFEEAQLRNFDPKLAKTIYKRLLEPVMSKVPEGSSLIIIPDGVLALLPFEALVVKGKADWKEGDYGEYPVGLTYLDELHPLSYSQSLTTLALQPAAARDRKKSQQSILVIADPVFQMTDSRIVGKKKTLLAAAPKQAQVTLMAAIEKEIGQKLQFSRLPKTGELAADLAELFGKKCSVYKGLEASKQRFLSDVAPQIKNYEYVVFATHGVYSTAIPAFQEPVLTMTMVPPGTDGFLGMTELMSLNLNADVVALTACQTAMGELVTGEGVMSIGRAVQYAGAQSVLMTLWSVEETASVTLVDSFFRYRHEGQSKLKALSQARLELRREGYEHPFFWASFILVGVAD